MSLLLNALKKADEGEDKQSGDTAATPAAAAAPGTPSTPATPAVASTPVTPAATTTPAPAAGGIAMKVSADEKPAKTADFDSIPDEGATTPAAAAAVAPQKGRKRVDAARIFAAAAQGQGEGGPSRGRRIVYSIAGVVLVVLAGGGLLYSGLIPGFTLGGLIGYDLGGGKVVQRSAPAETQAPLDSGEGVLLPTPEIDVQAEIDFAVSNLPADQDDSKENLAERVALITGYNIANPEEPVLDETGDIPEELVIDEEGEVVVEEVYDEIVTAERSRDKKFSVDSTTPSDSQIEIKLNSAVADAADIADEYDDEEFTAEESADTDSIVRRSRTAAADENGDANGGIKVEASAEGIDRARALESARDNYQRGQFARAEAVYRDVLRHSPTNVDALRGLAQVAVATRRYQLAASTYLQILEYYPNDAVAVAELVNLQGGVDFRRVERSLKKILSKNPRAAGRLHFTLGNLYASREQWLEAQQSYFQAFSTEPGNPDYAYNLAVVLDYLNKPGLAARYYDEALKLMGDSPVGFDAATVRARMRDLNS